MTNLDEMIEFYELCGEVKKKINRELNEEETNYIWHEFMNSKNKKREGVTEMTMQELAEQYACKGLKTLIVGDKNE